MDKRIKILGYDVYRQEFSIFVEGIGEMQLSLPYLLTVKNRELEAFTKMKIREEKAEELQKKASSR